MNDSRGISFKLGRWSRKTELLYRCGDSFLKVEYTRIKIFGIRTPLCRGRYISNPDIYSEDTND